MNKNLLLIVSMVLVGLLFLMPTVLATVEVIAPKNITNISGSVTFCCRYENNTDALNPLNLTANVNWTYNLSGTDTAITATSIACDDTHCNATVDTTSLTDGLELYTIKCVVSNATGTKNWSAVNTTKITIDNTDPTCTLLIDSVTIPWKGNQQVEWNTEDAISLISTAVTVDGPETQTTSSYTDAYRELDLTSQDTKYVGEWIIKVGARDRTFNSCNTSSNFTTYLPGDADWQKPTGPTNYKTLLLIGGIALVIYLFTKKK